VRFSIHDFPQYLSNMSNFVRLRLSWELFFLPGLVNGNIDPFTCDFVKGNITPLHVSFCIRKYHSCSRNILYSEIFLYFTCHFVEGNIDPFRYHVVKGNITPIHVTFCTRKYYSPKGYILFKRILLYFAFQELFLLVGCWLFAVSRLQIVFILTICSRLQIVVTLTICSRLQIVVILTICSRLQIVTSFHNFC